MQHVHYYVFFLNMYISDLEITLDKFATHLATPLCVVLVIWVLNST